MKPLAQKNRQEFVAAEQVLWQAIRNGQISGFKFRRQHAIDRFIVDFCCREASLVIEVDGPSHELSRAEDVARQTILESQNLVVLRFKNEDVLSSLDKVIRTIQLNLPLSVNGEGAGG